METSPSDEKLGMEDGIYDPDYIKDNPFAKIYIRKQNDETFFYLYFDYEFYLNHLRIIWHRLQQDYGMYEKRVQMMANLTEEERGSIEICQHLSHSIGDAEQTAFLDTESLIIFSRILLDKIGYMVEYLIKPDEQLNNDGFTNHKKFFTSHTSYNSEYSAYLKDKTGWYDILLTHTRNKLIVHSRKGMTRGSRLSQDGLALSKKSHTFSFRDEDVAALRTLQRKYGIKSRDITTHDSLEEILQYFLTGNLVLENDDIVTLGRIVRESGGEIFAEPLIKHIQKFIEDVASIIEGK